MKICGLTRRCDVELAVELGAGYVGFVLVPASPRCVPVERLRELTGGLPAGVKRVGVFADADRETILRAAEGNFDIIQLHGEESPEFAASLPYPVWKAVRAVAAHLPVAVVTNGIPKVQHGRMDPSPPRQYLSAFIISGELGVQKPDPRMLYAALEALGGVDRSRALMVGDSLTSDIRAANRAGIDACWYNPEGKAAPPEYSIRYEIADIRALPDIALQ